MKIKNTTLDDAELLRARLSQNAQRKAQTSVSNNASTGTGEESVKISALARELESLDVSKEGDTVRADKVAEFKEKIAKGYRVDSESLARKLIVDLA